MPIYCLEKKLRTYIYLFIPLIIVSHGILAYYNLWIGILGFLLFTSLIVLLLLNVGQFRKETESYIKNHSSRIEGVARDVVLHMPVGMMLIGEDESHTIEWANPYMKKCLQENDPVGKSLYEVANNLVPVVKQGGKPASVELGGRVYHAWMKEENHLLYLFDRTDLTRLERKLGLEKPVVAMIYLDNYDEITRGMDDETRGNINSRITTILNEWARKYGFFLKRTNPDRFVAFMNEKILSRLEEERFSILDVVRDLMTDGNAPLTLSIGIGRGDQNLSGLGTLAQSGLDLALGRGGDQVVIKSDSGKVDFFGGKTNPMEKRTRVRSRVISHALRELIRESSHVFIMGHRRPDMDVLGAAIGVQNMARKEGIESHIVLDGHELDGSVKKLCKKMAEHPLLARSFISPEDALLRENEKALLVIVDTHRPSMVINERLLESVRRTVVIDHHRRSEEFVEHPLLVYMEPYASSTSELVAELLEYVPDVSIDPLEASALLAGIVVDTKGFTLRTGSRTFSAASFLRSKGADTVLVQKLLRENMESFRKRARLLERAKVLGSGVAIATGDEREQYNRVILAQTADALLSMEGVESSFAIGYIGKGTVGISARSLGKMNVQLIMEKLNGGGHLTNAATLLENISVREAERLLLDVVENYLTGGI